jgi:hypothetical protein
MSESIWLDWYLPFRAAQLQDRLSDIGDVLQYMPCSHGHTPPVAVLLQKSIHCSQGCEHRHQHSHLQGRVGQQGGCLGTRVSRHKDQHIPLVIQGLAVKGRSIRMLT